MNIGISSWSLNREFIQNKISIIDFIRIAKEEFGVDSIEIIHWMAGDYSPENMSCINSAFKQIEASMSGLNTKKDQYDLQLATKAFMTVMDEISTKVPKNIEQVKVALDKYNVKVLNVPIDFGNISGVDEELRKSDLAVIKKWIDVAAFLGSKGARVNTGSQPEGFFDLSITAASYRELADYAERRGVALILENHGGMSADPKNILKIFEMVNHPNFRICPDFGNFENSIRFDALDMIFNNAILVHAKTYEFDENGDHVAYDFAKCIQIAKKHNYSGYYSVEFEGPGDQYEGVKKTIVLLKRFI